LAFGAAIQDVWGVLLGETTKSRSPHPTPNNLNEHPTHLV